MTLLNLLKSGRALALLFAISFVDFACATVTPVELTNARAAYARASTGPAAELRPVDLQRARSALDQAEQSFQHSADQQETVDLAYIAERLVQIAEARAQGALSEKKSTARIN